MNDEYERLDAQHKLMKDENMRREHKLLFEAIDNLTAERDAALARVNAMEGQEPVAWQYRTRADWIPDWGLWQSCSKELYENYIAVPKLHDWYYEARALFILASGAAPKGEQA